MKIKKIGMYIMLVFLISTCIIILSENSSAGSYDGRDLAEAIVNDNSLIVDTSYIDTDTSYSSTNTRMSGVFSSFGDMGPTYGSDFMIISTGIAGAYPVTTNQEDPGCERGTWFMGGEEYSPQDKAELTMTLDVPPLAQYLKYDIRFFSSEYPDWVGEGYNDRIEIKVDAPSQDQESVYFIDVDSNLFRDEANDIIGTGFDIFAVNGDPNQGRNDVTTELGDPSDSDAGATILWRVENEHPVLGPEEITVTITIADENDNRYDSAAYLDNFRFEEYAETSLEARKYVRNMAEEEIQYADSGETVKYIVQILNGGDISLNNNEFEDLLDENLELVDGTLTAEYGSVEYLEAEHKITWTGTIPSKDYIEIKYQATIKDSTINGTLIPNQGSIHWDQNNDGTLDSWSYTDYANITAINFVAPYEVIEDFSDDSAGGIATESYLTKTWFETGPESAVESTFSVVSGYKYQTNNAFKTKLRASSGKMYWYYDLDNIESDIEYWEVMLACGNTSEASDLILDFKNSNEENIARIKLDYLQEGTETSTDYILKPYYWDVNTEWTEVLDSLYLYNGWYKLRIKKEGSNYINYILKNANDQEIANTTDSKLNAAFSDFDHIEIYSTKEPVICPMFFWDEHKIGLIN